MKFPDTIRRLKAADKILNQNTTSRKKFKALRTLIKGINPQLDQTLKQIDNTLIKLEKVYQKKVVDLTLQNLPAKTPEQKKRKKLFLLFFRYWKKLKTEVKSVQKEFEKNQHQNNLQTKTTSVTKLIHHAKGPFGLITLAAVAIVGFSLLTKTNPQPQLASAPSPTIKVIKVNDKYLPLDQLSVTSSEAGCGFEHYHAVNHQSVIALDNTTVPDPGGCGYGTVDSLTIINLPL